MNCEMENHGLSLEGNDSTHVACFSFLIDCEIQSLNQDEWIQCIFCCSLDFGIIEITQDCLPDEWHIRNHQSI